MDSKVSFILGAFLGALIAGALVGHGLRNLWEAACVERGAGEYDPNTGYFRWK